jgi:hypothetical protein
MHGIHGIKIFLTICLSKMRRLFSSFAVKVQVSDEYVTTGLIIVVYIFILVFFFKAGHRISELISQILSNGNPCSRYTSILVKKSVYYNGTLKVTEPTY